YLFNIFLVSLLRISYKKSLTHLNFQRLIGIEPPLPNIYRMSDVTKMRMFKAEWKKVFRHKMLILMMIVIPLVPIIYSGIILSAYWDPFGNTSNLPVAVVDQDEPSELEGETLNIGDELITNLKENDDLDWHFVSQNEAQAGFESGDFYMVITIPKDFSKRASTVLEDNPEKM